jgi:hypothetical protein
LVGDIDIVVAGKKYDPAWTDERFDSKGFVKSGDILSFECRGFQVDLIHVPRASFRLACIYFHADFGIIIGVFAKSLLLKFGHEALSARISSRGGDIPLLLSRDADNIFSFFGLPPFPEHGFDGVQHMFDYIKLGRFDVRAMKKVHNYSVRDRIRKRVNFADFLELVDNMEGTANQEDIVAEAAEYFGKTEELKALLNKIHTDEHVASIFNGQIVSAATGLTDKALGEFMRAFKKKHSIDLKWTVEDVKKCLQKK